MKKKSAWAWITIGTFLAFYPLLALGLAYLFIASVASWWPFFPPTIITPLFFLTLASLYSSSVFKHAWKARRQSAPFLWGKEPHLMPALACVLFAGKAFILLFITDPHADPFRNTLSSLITLFASFFLISWIILWLLRIKAIREIQRL